MSNEHGSEPEILCIYGSPRVHGNTDLLMDAFASGVEQAGGRAERVYLRNLKISPCREIYACRDKGKCALRDDMDALYDRLKESAKANRRSINQEAIARLSEMLLVRRSSPEETIARLEALHPRLRLRPLSPKEIRRAIRPNR